MLVFWIANIYFRGILGTPAYDMEMRICTGSSNYSGCMFENEEACCYTMQDVAADRLERLNTFDKTQSTKFLGKINAIEPENELLRGVLASFGADKEGAYYEGRTDHSAGS